VTAEVLLPIALEVAVPLRVAELRALDDEAFAALFALEDLDAMAQRICGPGGEGLLHRVPGKSATAFVAAVDAIALLAFCPGGISIFGRTWEATR
jgi:hypothetical protein